MKDFGKIVNTLLLVSTISLSSVIYSPDAKANDINAGKEVSKKCLVCHTLEKGALKKIGPNLWNVVGSDIASKEGFDYSNALKALEGNWSNEKLDKFIENPMAYAKGTKMTFIGLKNKEDREHIIEYLNTLKD